MFFLEISQNCRGHAHNTIIQYLRYIFVWWWLPRVVVSPTRQADDVCEVCFIPHMHHDATIFFSISVMCVTGRVRLKHGYSSNLFRDFVPFVTSLVITE